VTAALTIPGQNAVYSVGTPTTSRVSLTYSAGVYGTLSLRDPAGTTLVSVNPWTVGFIEPWTFASGQTNLVDPFADYTGSTTLTAYDMPPIRRAPSPLGARRRGGADRHPGPERAQSCPPFGDGAAGRRAPSRRRGVRRGTPTFNTPQPDESTPRERLQVILIFRQRAMGTPRALAPGGEAGRGQVTSEQRSAFWRTPGGPKARPTPTRIRPSLCRWLWARCGRAA
jgi:hypothetical protein